MEDTATCVNTCIEYRELYITHIHGAGRKAQVQSQGFLEEYTTLSIVC